MIAFIVKIYPVIMSSPPVGTKREVGVGIVVRPVFVLQGRVVSAGSRRVRTSDQRVSVGEGV